MGNQENVRQSIDYLEMVPQLVVDTGSAKLVLEESALLPYNIEILKKNKSKNLLEEVA